MTGVGPLIILVRMGVWSNKCHTKEMLESGLMFAQSMNQSVCVCKFAICVAALTSGLPWQLLTVFEGEWLCVQGAFDLTLLAS